MLVPKLPMGGSGGAERRWTIVDRSASMQAEGAAVRAADEVGGAARGRTLELTDPSRLAPLLVRAAEGGARAVDLVTDLRIADAATALAVADELGLTLDVTDVGADVRSAGIARLEVAPSARAGDTLEVRVGVFATDATEGAGARVILALDGRDVARDSLVLAPPGAEAGLRFRAAVPDSAGLAVWQVRLEFEGDAFALDDRRRAVTRVDPSSGIVALVSLRPDWDARTLLPLLGEAAGLPARGWLRVGRDAWLAMGGGGVIDGAALAPLLAEARILVVHGAGAAMPDPVTRALERVPRRLLVPATAELPGEWYPAPGEPARFAPLLADLELAALPPLTLHDLETLTQGSSAPETAPETALWLEHPGGGRAPGIRLVDEPDRRRTALVAASGFRRWDARSGDAREAYRRLFSGIAGWLLALEPAAAEGAIGPVRPLVRAGEPVVWQAPGHAGQQATIVWRRDDDDPVRTDPVRTDTVLVAADGTATLPPFADGVWHWQATLEGDPPVVAEGRLASDAATTDLRPPRAAALAEGVRPAAARDLAPDGIPWRTTPWPWLAVLALLSVEWIVRRRSGLR